MKGSLEIYSKHFFVGEYAVLAGGWILGLGTNPSFRFEGSDEGPILNFHSQSPAGKFCAQHNPPLRGEFFDPFEASGVSGGAGRSTAEFLAAYAARNRNEDLWGKGSGVSPETVWQAWQVYRDLHTGESVRPSGADLIVQMLGQGFVWICPEQRVYKQTQWPFPDLQFELVKTNLKIPTHEHLADLRGLLQKNAFQSLVGISLQIKTVWEDASRINPLDTSLASKADLRSTFVSLMKSYRTELKSLGLEHPQTTKLLEQYEGKRRVLAGKGCGALGADYILLLKEI